MEAARHSQGSRGAVSVRVRADFLGREEIDADCSSQSVAGDSSERDGRTLGTGLAAIAAAGKISKSGRRDRGRARVSIMLWGAAVLLLWPVYSIQNSDWVDRFFFNVLAMLDPSQGSLAHKTGCSGGC